MLTLKCQIEIRSKSTKKTVRFDYANSIEVKTSCNSLSFTPFVFSQHKNATESVDWEYEEDVTTLAEKLKAEGYAIILVEQTDGSVMLQDFDFTQYSKVALVVGNEVFGVSDGLLPICDAAVEIPQYGTKHSLNVAVATGIVLWEAVLQLVIRDI